MIEITSQVVKSHLYCHDTSTCHKNFLNVCNFLIQVLHFTVTFSPYNFLIQVLLFHLHYVNYLSSLGNICIIYSCHTSYVLYVIYDARIYDHSVKCFETFNLAEI